ncbi:MAG: hypothetical protein ACXWC9_11020 [Pseudobdellovibrionaceae bacterium]
MSRLIFINLAIDQLWDPEKNLSSLFPARIPESEHLVRINENMGLFLSETGDQVLMYQDTQGWREFLQRHSSSWGEVIEISAHPFDQELWLSQARLKLKDRGPFSEFISASLSGLEDSLLRNSSLFPFHRPALDTNALSALNRKVFLVDLAQLGFLKVPPTDVYWQKDLLSTDFPAFSDPRILKHDFGSGGAANFLLSQSSDSTLTMLQRRLSPNTKAQWLLQKKISASFEGSVFGWGHDSIAPKTAQVFYTAQGLSYRHEFQVPEDIQKEAAETFRKLRLHLQSLGYTGPIGLDFLISSENNEMYFVDLNLRLTKTHLLALAAQKFSLSLENLISIRHRWREPETLRFQSWWDRSRKALSLNDKGEDPSGQLMIPYSVAGIESPGPIKEVSFFISRSPNFEKAVMQLLGPT